jgi:ubiquinone/menaquinone biosynthesis C-methylase UbiE
MPLLQWDYTALADHYVNRPDYAAAAVEEMLQAAAVQKSDPVTDMGAGAGHLTIHLCRRDMQVTAIEPNPAMRRHGRERTRDFPAVRWLDAVMENTGLPPNSQGLVTYGSSFGVADHASTLAEAARVLRPGASMACIFNHRDLDDPLQASIESLIRGEVSGYDYGSRRRDQAQYIEASGLFGQVTRIEKTVWHRLPVLDWVDAWRSHATLQRQSGARFNAILEGIERLVASACDQYIDVPYITRAWTARRT